jgi:hypothetical protein
VHPRVQGFDLPKAGNAQDEYEDAVDFSIAARRFAIADGATESSFADRWAHSLVQRFTAGSPFAEIPSWAQFDAWLRPLQREWHHGIPWERLPWYAEEKAQEGAFCTFLGLEFFAASPLTVTDPAPRSAPWWRRLIQSLVGGSRHAASASREVERLQWNAFAVGDTCLFQVREGQLLRGFPLERAADFNNRPALVSSRQEANRSVANHARFASGHCLVGDVFLLATDALAHWLLARHEQGQPVWTEITALSSRAEFAGLVSTGRDTRTLRNDDTTLLLCHWEASSQSPSSPDRPGPAPAG